MNGTCTLSGFWISGLFSLTYRFDDLVFKDFSRTFQGLLTVFKESISTSTTSHISIFKTNVSVAPCN